MLRRLLVVPLLLILGCDDSTGPASDLYPGYFLSSINGDILPVPFLDDGTELIAGGLSFGGDRPRAGSPLPGVVTYRTTIRRPDFTIEDTILQLNYRVEGETLIINLCPPLALCIQSAELIGPVDRTQLVLTRYMGGQPGSVERYHAALPD